MTVVGLICWFKGHNWTRTGVLIDGEEWPGADHFEPACFEQTCCSRCGATDSEFLSWGSVAEYLEVNHNYRDGG